MIQTNKESKEKIERIKELKGSGLNTPEAFYLKKFADPDILTEAFEWAAKTHYYFPTRTFNIRIYNYSREIETFRTEHFTNVSFDDLENLVLDVNLNSICIIDTEAHNNATFAGDIIIKDVISPAGKVINSKYTIRYCKKDSRAMVEDQDNTVYGDVGMINKALPFQLQNVIDKANIFFHNKILEWSWFKIPTGELGENLIFWEYRNLCQKKRN